MSKVNWRKVITMSPIAVIAGVIIVIIATDFAFFGSADEPKPENQAPPVPAVGAVTPLPATYVPLPTETATPPPTAVTGPAAQARDQTRKDDLAKIQAALEQYKAKEGQYPDTSNNPQTACTYQEVDALCKLKDYLDPVPADPQGDPGQNGYWYLSDGKTFTLIAAMDMEADATPTKCDPNYADTLKKSNLYCVTSSG
ncbi:MAG: type II secretion system protein GspG [Dehalococcoidia bacterium]